MKISTTPVPNTVFDEHLKNLNGAELKVFLIIIRQTLGWRKNSDWISGSQLRNKTGLSQRSIVSALQILIDKKLIEVLSSNGVFLDSPEKRKGKKQLFYCLSEKMLSPTPVFKKRTGVENSESAYGKSRNTYSTYANFSPDLRKKITSLTQKMRITNYTSYK